MEGEGSGALIQSIDDDPYRRYFCCVAPAPARHPSEGKSGGVLLGRSEVPPEPPSDGRLTVELSCPCPDWRELQSFARDPAGLVTPPGEFIVFGVNPKVETAR